MYDFGAYMLSIDHVQGDPFAAPSKVHIEVSGQKAGFPKEYYDTEDKRTAVQDFVLRLFAGEVQNYSFQAKGSGKSGLLSVSRCGQEILSRSACQMDNHTGSVTVRLEIGFPAHGRTIDAKALEKILFGYLPECVKRRCIFGSSGKRITKSSPPCRRYGMSAQTVKRKKSGGICSRRCSASKTVRGI